MKMKEKMVLLFSICTVIFFEVTSAASIDERFQNMESVIQSLLAENKELKTRLDQLEKLQDRVIALEENCEFSDKSVRNGDTALEENSGMSKKPEEDRDTIGHIPEAYQESMSSDGEHAGTTDDREEYTSPERDMVLNMSQSHGIVNSDVASTAWHRPKRAAESEVAFHVYLSGSRCYSNHEIFKFDIEPVDIGGGFNTADGIFDAPATGVYVFSWTVAAPIGSYFSAELIVNGVVKGVVVTDPDVNGSGHGIHPATGVVLANVNAGNHVFIRFIQGASCHIRSDGYVRTTFTGWLLL